MQNEHYYLYILPPAIISDVGFALRLSLNSSQQRCEQTHFIEYKTISRILLETSHVMLSRWNSACPRDSTTVLSNNNNNYYY